MYMRPTTFTQWMNRSMSWLAKLGMTPSDTITLEVKGRKSGATRANVVTSIDVNGARYLVAPRGETEWVRNVRAAKGDATIRHRGRKHVRLEELPVEQRPPVLKPYLQKMWRATASHFDIDKDAPVEEFAKVAPDHPVFRIHDA